MESAPEIILSNRDVRNWVTNIYEFADGAPILFGIHTNAVLLSLFSTTIGIFLTSHNIYKKKGLFQPDSRDKPGIRPLPNECLVVMLTGFALVTSIYHLILLGSRLEETQLGLVYSWRHFFQNLRYGIGFMGLASLMVGLTYSIPTNVAGQDVNAQKFIKVPPTWVMDTYLMLGTIGQFLITGIISFLCGYYYDLAQLATDANEHVLYATIGHSLYTVFWVLWGVIGWSLGLSLVYFGNILIIICKGALREMDALAGGRKRTQTSSSGKNPAPQGDELGDTMTNDTEFPTTLRRQSMLVATLKSTVARVRQLFSTTESKNSGPGNTRKRKLEQAIFRMRMFSLVFPFGTMTLGTLDFAIPFIGQEDNSFWFYLPAFCHLTFGPVIISLVFVLLGLERCREMRQSKG